EATATNMLLAIYEDDLSEPPHRGDGTAGDRTTTSPAGEVPAAAPAQDTLETETLEDSDADQDAQGGNAAHDAQGPLRAPRNGGVTDSLLFRQAFAGYDHKQLLDCATYHVFNIGTFLLLIPAGHEEAGKPTTAWTANLGRDKVRHVQHAPVGLDGRPYKLDPVGFSDVLRRRHLQRPLGTSLNDDNPGHKYGPPSDGD
ncbi:hypothetical protein MRX96_050996, partial [Rhipicephalus microplus]